MKPKSVRDIMATKLLTFKPDVKDFMSTNVTTVNPEMGIVDLAQMLQETHFRRLPVVENGKLIGQVSRRDLLKAIQ